MNSAEHALCIVRKQRSPSVVHPRSSHRSTQRAARQTCCICSGRPQILCESANTGKEWSSCSVTFFFKVSSSSVNMNMLALQLLLSSCFPWEPVDYIHCMVCEIPVLINGHYVSRRYCWWRLHVHTMCMGHQHTGIDSTHPQGAEEVCIQLVLHEALLFHWHFFLN